MVRGKIFQHINDTPENIARAMFGIEPVSKRKKRRATIVGKEEKTVDSKNGDKNA